jgi:hypothetical protein
MKRILLFVCLSVIASVLAVAATSAQTTDAEFQQAVGAYQQSHSYADIEKVINLAAAMPQPPAIPTEARRHFIRGAALIKDAKSQTESAQAADEFLQAARLAPWWAEARYNTAVAFEAAGDYANTIANLKIYQMFKLPNTEAQTIQDKIWTLEAKQEKINSAAAAERQRAEAAAAAEQAAQLAEQRRQAEIEAERQALIKLWDGTWVQDQANISLRKGMRMHWVTTIEGNKLIVTVIYDNTTKYQTQGQSVRCVYTPVGHRATMADSFRISEMNLSEDGNTITARTLDTNGNPDPRLGWTEEYHKAQP